MWYPKVGNNAVFPRSCKDVVFLRSVQVIVSDKTAHEWYCARRGEYSPHARELRHLYEYAHGQCLEHTPD